MVSLKRNLKQAFYDLAAKSGHDQSYHPYLDALEKAIDALPGDELWQKFDDETILNALRSIQLISDDEGKSNDSTSLRLGNGLDIIERYKLLRSKYMGG